VAAENPAVPGVPLTVQLNAAAVTVEDRPMEVSPPLHIACEEGVATTLAIGFTVTITDTALPPQPTADGVTVYVTSAGAAPVLVRICAMLLPAPAEKPAVPVPPLTVHENVVPATVGDVLSAIAVAVPLQKF
jgi:hypothetical protein